MKICGSCGGQNEDNMNFCNYCGARLALSVQYDEEPMDVLPASGPDIPVPRTVQKAIDPDEELKLLKDIEQLEKANKESNLVFLKVSGAICGGLLLISLLIFLISKPLGIVLMTFAFLGFFVILGFFCHRLSKQKEAVNAQKDVLEKKRGKIRVSRDAIFFYSDCGDEEEFEAYKVHFSAMVQQLMSMGFTNVKAISLGDLREGNKRYNKLNGYVAE